MASEIRVNKINSRTGVGTITLSPTGVDFTGIATVATLKATTGIVTTLSVTGTTTLNGNLDLQDNDKILIGTGDDLEIYHDGTHSHIVSNTGNLRILADGSGSLVLTSKAGEEAITCAQDGAVTIKHDNSTKFATTSTGVTITGTATATEGLVLDGQTGSGKGLRLDLAGSGDYVIQETTTDDVVQFGGTGASNFFVHNISSGRIGIGITNPADLLHIKSASGNANVRLTTGNTSSGFTALIFGDTDDSNTGTVQYDHSNNSLQFEVNNSERMRIHAGGTLSVPTGIELGSGLDGTSANTLDDYEEGDFDVSYTSGLTGDTYSNTSAHYTKIGNFVTFTIRIAGAGTNSGSEQVKIGNLPFTASGTTREGGAWFNYKHDLETGGAPYMHISKNSTVILWYNASGSNWVGSDGAGLNNKTFHIQGFYYTDS